MEKNQFSLGETTEPPAVACNVSLVACRQDMTVDSRTRHQ